MQKYRYSRAKLFQTKELKKEEMSQKRTGRRVTEKMMSDEAGEVERTNDDHQDSRR